MVIKYIIGPLTFTSFLQQSTLNKNGEKMENMKNIRQRKFKRRTRAVNPGVVSSNPGSANFLSDD